LYRKVVLSATPNALPTVWKRGLRDNPSKETVDQRSRAQDGRAATSRKREQCVDRQLDVHFSSRSNDWSTPTDLFNELNDVFHFDLDACADADNAKCPRYFTKEQNALMQQWRGTVWMNPPFGREIAKFMRKAYEESLLGATVVCLVSSRTDTDWWHRYAKRGHFIFLRGRLKFGNAESSAPFPSAIVIFWSGRLGQATRPELQP